ncbi:MAG: bifunctional nuclease family protein [Dehalococcoidia bacterium]|nr:bifunctional nuclease family protein [Dehalococcoidia bacterium]
MVEMTIESIRVSLMNYQRVVILKEKDNNRYLPIWIGPNEADAIAVKLQNVELNRPLTHDLLQSVITTLGASVNFVVVSALQNDTFYGKLDLNVGDEEVEIDSRPSDALALAVRMGVPIYAEEAVLAKAGITLEEEARQPGSEGKAKDKLDDKELKGLSAYEDFVNTLDLEDFKKRKS